MKEKFLIKNITIQHHFMNPKIFILSTAFVGLALLTGCGDKTETSKIPLNDEAIPVKIMALDKSAANGTIHVSGQFTTNDETFLSFKTGGVIQKIYVKEGDKVRKGQVLAVLDLTEINAQVNQAKIGLEKATRDYKRAENLYKDSVASLEQFQNAKSGLELAQQQLAAAQFNLSYSSIRATQDGVILRKLAQEGQITGPGTPVLQTNSKGQSDWILRVAVSDRDWASIALNTVANVEIEGLGLNNIDAFVYSKSETADPMTGSFTIELKLRNAKSMKIASGMFGKASIPTSSGNDVWKIPFESILDGNAGNGFVFVTNDNKTALKVPVKILSIEQNTVLISEGLLGYKAIIVSGSAYLTDKSTIKVVK